VAQESQSGLDHIQRLYDESRCLEAWHHARAHGPLEEWTGVQETILAGRLAAMLGSPRLAALIHWRGSRRHPEDLDLAIYRAYGQLGRRGPLRALELLDALPASGTTPSEKSLAHLHSVRARVLSEFNDFEMAQAEFGKARTLNGDDPWLDVVESGLLEKQDDYEAALDIVRRLVADHPLYRPGLQSVAHLLQTLGRSEEARSFLKEAIARTECGPLVAQLAALEMELENHEQALTLYDRYLDLSPMADEQTREWVDQNRVAVACRMGQLDLAHRLSEQLPGQYYQDLASRLRTPAPSRRRVKLPVQFVRQHHLTCAPATLTALSRYWNRPVAHLELAEEICYDGTPTHSERRWAENSGFTVREFTVTWEAARSLVDRGIPFTLTTEEATSGHLQAVVGYDELRQSLLVRDPSLYNVSEALCPQFLERYRASGPRGMAMVTAEAEARLAQLELPDQDLYDLLYQVNSALDKHDRAEAQGTLETMQETAPGHRLTLTASRILNGYDNNSAGLLESVENLLNRFPADSNLALTKYGCLTEHGSRDQRIAFLHERCQQPDADPLLFVRLGEELRSDSTALPNARHWVRRALRCRPIDAEFLKVYANVLWDMQDHEAAAIRYRLAACVADRREAYARDYFRAVRLLRRPEDGLALLRHRVTQLGRQSSQPHRTLYEALVVLDRVEEAFAVLDEAIKQHPNDGDLRLFMADAHARFGRRDIALAHLQAAGGQTKRTTWLRTAASLATYGGDRLEALRYWREVLETEPLAMDANDAVAWLLVETEGKPAAIEFVNIACDAFPHHCDLRRLRVEVVRDEPKEVFIEAVRSLLQTNPADAWAWRELALTSTDQSQCQEALQAADRSIQLAPHDSFGYGTRGAVHLRTRNLQAAHEDFRKALTVAIDNAYAIEKLMETAGEAAGQRAALAFIQDELRRQLNFGQGLQCFRNVARALLPPEEVLGQLTEAHAARPDLWAAWSVLVLQLNDMGQSQKALDLVQEACRRFPFVPRLWFDRAQVHHTRLQPTEAMAALEQALSITPGYGDAARFLAELQEQTGAFDAAQHTLESACARSPLDAVNRGCLASLQWRRGERAAALRNVQHALQLAPDYSWAWNALRDWGEQSDQPDLALTLARDLVERRPGEPQSWALLAESLADRDDPSAVETVDKALALNPQNVDLLDLKARLLTGANQFNEALEVCRQVDPAPPALLMRAAWIEARRGRLKRAIGMMGATLQQHPAHFGAWETLSYWCEQAGDLAQATEAADQMARLSPHDSVPLVRSGELRLRQQDGDGAREQFQRAFDLEPNAEYAGLVLFDLLLERNNLSAADGVLQRLERHHDTDRVLACRVKLEVHLERRDEALQAFAKLCRWPSEDSSALFRAASALTWRKTRSRMRKQIKADVENPDANPFLGSLWVAHRFERRAYGADRRLHRLFAMEKSGRHTLTYYLDALGNRQDQLAATPSAWTQPNMTRFFKSVFRRHQERLWAEDVLWGKTGYWLVNAEDYNRAADWLADWPNRKNLESWMIYNLALALEVTQRPQEALPVLRQGLALPQDPDLYLNFVAITAFEEALAGNLAAAKDLIAGADTDRAGALDKAILGFTEAICLATSADPIDSADRRRSVKREIRKATGELAPTRLHELGRSCYRRLMRHLGMQPELSRLKFWGWWNYRRGNWIGMGIVGLLSPFLIIMMPIGPIVLYYLWRRLLK
jgi:tetratricopeptide (TPR) repeat protein